MGWAKSYIFLRHAVQPISLILSGRDGPKVTEGGGPGGPKVSHLDSQSDSIGGSKSISGCENIYWDSLPA